MTASSVLSNLASGPPLVMSDGHPFVLTVNFTLPVGLTWADFTNWAWLSVDAAVADYPVLVSSTPNQLTATWSATKIGHELNQSRRWELSATVVGLSRPILAERYYVKPEGTKGTTNGTVFDATVSIGDLAVTATVQFGEPSTGLVSSVNGEIGDVVLTTADLADFGEGVDARISTTLVEGDNINLEYDDETNELVISGTSAGSLDAVDITVTDVGGFYTGANVETILAELPGRFGPVYFGVAVSDETTSITAGTAKITFRMPFAMSVSTYRSNINTVSSSGIVTVDVNENGSTVLSTKLTIDQGEKTSTTAAVPAVISDAALADDAEITIDIDVAGTGAKGLKVWFIGTRTS